MLRGIRKGQDIQCTWWDFKRLDEKKKVSWTNWVYVSGIIDFYFWQKQNTKPRFYCSQQNNNTNKGFWNKIIFFTPIKNVSRSRQSPGLVSHSAFQGLSHESIINHLFFTFFTKHNTVAIHLSDHTSYKFIFWR